MEVIKAPAKSLYQIRIDHLTLIQEIEDNDGELDEEIEKQLALTNEEFEDKAVSYGLVVKHFDDEADIIAKEIQRLSTRLSAVNKRKELFKERLSEAMKQFGYEKIETPILKLSFRKSASTEVSETFSNMLLMYFNCSFEINKEKVDEAFKVLDKEKDADELQLLSLLTDLQGCFNVKPSFVKTPITNLLKAGIKIPGASIKENKNLQIK
jgi:hypothetical protein